jgi:molybdate transport system regulatory protein
MAHAAIRLRVDFGPQLAVGPGKIALLEAIRSAGSLSQAARELGMSYRRAWLLLDSLNGAFVAPVARSSKGGRHGGGSQLTPLGEQLIRTYRSFETAAQQRARRDFQRLAGQLRRPRRGRAVLPPRPLHARTPAARG